MEEDDVEYYVNKNNYSLYMRLKDDFQKYLDLIVKRKEDKQKQIDEYQNSVKELEKKKEEQNNIIQKKEEILKELNEEKSQIEDFIEKTKLENELKELKANNKLEENKLKNEAEIEILELENQGEIDVSKKGLELSTQAIEKSNYIDKIQLKYEKLKEIYNENEFDELIKLTNNKYNEMINDESELYQDQKNELEDFRQKTDKKIENIKKKNELVVEKEKLKLENYKFEKYNNFLIEKKNKFNEFKNNFSDNQVCNDNLKRKEIEKVKFYYEQQKSMLMNREQIFQQQKQNINAFIKQMEINDDEFSNNMKNQLLIQ